MTDQTKAHFKALASQLSCPHGTEGSDVANMMFQSNIGMISSAIKALNIQNGDVILELGHGNCRHLAALLQQAADLSYFGLEISPLMQQEAASINNAATNANKASFHLYNGDIIPFAEHTFDKILTVNTIYFWSNPTEFIKEIYRVLKPKGLLAISFADKDFMETLPFTAYGFNLYSAAQTEELLLSAGFNIIEILPLTEKIKDKSGNEIERLYYVALAQKQ